MTEYNAAFFKTIETMFRILKENYGEQKALEHLRELMRRNLGNAFRAMGAREKGGSKEFKRVVGARDGAAGLRVSFEDRPNGFAYRFHTDPFPGLKGEVAPEKLDATYMDFKREFLLGPGWKHTITRHLWQGHEFTEHLLTRE